MRQVRAGRFQGRRPFEGGSFKGEARCDERLELLPKSRFEGDIVTKTLNVHEGAIIDGRIQMASAKSIPADRGREAEAPLAEKRPEAATAAKQPAG